MTNIDRDLLELVDLPMLLLSDEQVTQANSVARTLLGSHIEKQDVRLALRDPEAIALIRHTRQNGTTGRTRLIGLSVRGSVWEMACHRLGKNRLLIVLYDLSVQASVARAHADFVANASHELRTPLASIIGYVETLSDPKAGEDAETRKRFLTTIRTEAQRIQLLVEDLMSLSRIEASRHEAPAENVDLVQLCREAQSEANLGNRLVFNFNHKTVNIAADRTQILQVLRNLIDNAAKYGKTDGEISMKLEAVDTGWVTVAVEDQGEGIAPEHLPRLTERFYRADASRSRAAGGTGLGLSIVKHIIERHRGRLDINSWPGQGTRVSIMLPTTKD
jgi:two-component system, OmpR family, phosphate regulon sensor histidine kinase PhoR